MAAVLAASTASVSAQGQAGRPPGKTADRTAYQGPLPGDYDIVRMSDFIYFGDHSLSTLVPKGAVLHVPRRYRANMVKAPKGKLLRWDRFLARNLGRVVPLEITREQAAGIKPIKPAKLDAAIRTGRIVVAVVNGNPTGVLRTGTGSSAAKENS